MIDTKNDEKTRKNHVIIFKVYTQKFKNLNLNIIFSKQPELNDAFFSKNLKIRALAYAFDKKFDYIFVSLHKNTETDSQIHTFYEIIINRFKYFSKFIKADVILINPETIKILVSKKK